MKRIKANGIKTIIYEPTLNETVFLDTEVVQDFNRFKQEADVIISNRMDSELADVSDKVYSRDLFGLDN